jgi:hypothetical protein
MEYFRCVRESDGPGLERIFARDATLYTFEGTIRRGRAEIRDFYETRAMGTGVEAYQQTPIEDANRCAVEIIVHHADGDVFRVVDLFTVDDEGSITNLHVYRGLLLEGDDARDPSS